MTHLDILTKREQNDFDLPPITEYKDKSSTFTLDDQAQIYFQTIRSKSHKIGFLLQYGYFGISNKFYQPNEFRKLDIAYLQSKLTTDNFIDLDSYDKNTRWRHRKAILEIYGWNELGVTEKNKITDYANIITKNSFNSRRILIELVRYIRENRIEVPRYHMLTGVVTSVLLKREKKLLSMVHKLFSRHGDSIVSQLLSDDNEMENIDNESRKKYRLSFFKNISKEESVSGISENIERFRQIKIFYTEFRPLIESLDLNLDGFKYIAEYVSKNKVSQLKQMGEDKRKLYLVSFVYINYFDLNDILTLTLLKSVQHHINSVDRQFNEYCAQHHIKNAKNHTEVLGSVKDIVFPLQLRILSILADDVISDQQKVALALEAYHSESDRVQKAELDVNNQFVFSNDAYKGFDRYKIMEKLSIKLQRRASQIILNIDYEYKSTDTLLTATIRYFKNNGGNIDNGCPQGFLRQNIRDILYREDGSFRVSLYKSFLYQHVAKAIKSGTLNVQHSMKYKEFESYLISDNEWNLEKDDLLKLAGIEDYKDVDKVISNMEIMLRDQIEQTNKNIIDEKNEHIRFRDDGGFFLNSSVISFYEVFLQSSRASKGPAILP